MLFLFPDRYEFFSFAQYLTEKIRKRNHHIYSLIRFICLDQPNNCIQCIIKEMRINLLLQQAQIGFSDLLLIFFDLADQLLHISGHVIEAFRQHFDLIF